MEQDSGRGGHQTEMPPLELKPASRGLWGHRGEFDAGA